MSKILQPTRIRQPWLPAPFQDAAAGVARGMLVVAVAAPMLLPGVRGIARLSTGIKDTPAMSRPMRVVTGQQPIPQGQALFLRGAQPTNPFERLAPVQLISGQQPTPLSSAWLPVGRKDDTSRLAPILLNVGAQPQPNGQAWLSIGIKDEPAAQPDRLIPPLVSVGQQFPPLSSVWLSVGIRDVVVTPSDRLAPLGITLGAQPTPQPVTILLRGARQTDPPRLAPLTVVVGQVPTPQFGAQFSPRPFDAPQQLPRPILAIVNYPPIPGATVTWLRSVLSNIVIPPISCADGVISGIRTTGVLTGQRTEGQIGGIAVAGAINGAATLGVIRGTQTEGTIDGC